MKTLKQLSKQGVLLFIICFSACKQMSDSQTGKFIESTCPFDLPESLVPGKNFRFGYVNVPEFHGKDNGKTLELAVAIFPSSNTEHATDPIVMNTSGPGKSNMDNFIPQIADMLGQYILPDRDIVIIELRGLRYSKPFLECDELSKARRLSIEKNLSYEESMSVQLEALKATKKRFDKEGINLSAFNNKETAADIAMIMDILGYGKFNMVGSSAGTLVAHHVIRDYPDRVRCAILDAGLPIDPTIMKDYVPSIVKTLKNYFDECKGDPDCAAAFPELENRFLQHLDSLNREPVIIPVKDPVTGIEIDYVLNGNRLSSYVFLNMFYSTQVPLIISKVLDGNYQDLTDFVSYSLKPDYFADGLGFTVFISESGNYTPKDINIDPKYEVFARGVDLLGLGGAFLHDLQDSWKITKLDAKKNQYSKPYDVPVLVMNGIYDPVIPVKYDQIMKKHLTNCYLYRFDGVPHSVFDNAKECALPMVLQFLNDPTKAPNSDCVKNYQQTYLLN